jgi:hypothetical protein
VVEVEGSHREAIGDKAVFSHRAVKAGAPPGAKKQKNGRRKQAALVSVQVRFTP